jgi:predicted DNA-binding transcriptional regulator AlpA
MSRASERVDGIAYAPRGLCREEAARYIGVSSTKFDQMVADRRMPKPKKVDARVIWDRVALDAAFSDLPDDGVNMIDELLSRRRS